MRVLWLAVVEVAVQSANHIIVLANNVESDHIIVPHLNHKQRVEWGGVRNNSEKRGRGRNTQDSYADTHDGYLANFGQPRLETEPKQLLNDVVNACKAIAE